MYKLFTLKSLPLAVMATGLVCGCRDRGTDAKPPPDASDTADTAAEASRAVHAALLANLRFRHAAKQGHLLGPRLADLDRRIVLLTAALCRETVKARVGDIAVLSRRVEDLFPMEHLPHADGVYCLGLRVGSDYFVGPAMAGPAP